nr:DUF1592 domain-containing protein [Verrucomicrobium spinosum]
MQIFLGIIQKARGEGLDFANAMLAGYTAVLCSPKFFCLEEKPGKLDQRALAARLAYFLWNSAPDEALLKADLSDPKVLRQQTDRLLNHPKSRQFVDAFLNYWLDLRKMGLPRQMRNSIPTTTWTTCSLSPPCRRRSFSLRRC